MIWDDDASCTSLRLQNLDILHLRCCFLESVHIQCPSVTKLIMDCYAGISGSGALITHFIHSMPMLHTLTIDYVCSMECAMDTISLLISGCATLKHLIIVYNKSEYTATHIYDLQKSNEEIELLVCQIRQKYPDIDLAVQERLKREQSCSL